MSRWSIILIAVCLCFPGAQAAALNVFELPDANPPAGLYRPNIQTAYPGVDWQTLDVLCLPAGHYKFVYIQNLPDRKEETPLTITNCGGQVRVGGLDHYYLFVLGGGSHWRLTGQYSSARSTGHPDYTGHADSQYADSRDRYGILIDDESIEHGGPSGLSIGGGATNFEIDFLEIRRVGFAGMLIKSDGDGEATMENVRIHNNYIHDIGSEGIYIGSTQAPPQHTIDGLQFYNNRVLRTGTEVFQLGQVGGGSEIFNNVFMAGAMDWKNPFQAFQNNTVQLGPRVGALSFRNNIVIGAGSAWLNFLGIDFESDNHPDQSVVSISNNYFSDSRHFGGYVARMTQPGLTIRIEDNQFRNLNFQYQEFDPNLANYNQFFRMGSGDQSNTAQIEFTDNQFDGDQFFINGWADPNQERGNIIGSGNQRIKVPSVRFENSGFSDDFDWLRLEIWTPEDFNGMPVAYAEGDVVSVNGELFVCGATGGCGAGLNPTYPANASIWTKRPAPADDVRLSLDSPLRDIGLLDGTGDIFTDRFESQ